MFTMRLRKEKEPTKYGKTRTDRELKRGKGQKRNSGIMVTVIGFSTGGYIEILRHGRGKLTAS